jgi:alkylation response protein AidB-like acyl-CoA dehydrogenase
MQFKLANIARIEAARHLIYAAAAGPGEGHPLRHGKLFAAGVHARDQRRHPDLGNGYSREYPWAILAGRQSSPRSGGHGEIQRIVIARSAEG